jgi:Zn-dependent peptidase ImmA (M78 family)/transcriptional regulator with XRE-family HTH domain
MNAPVTRGALSQIEAGKVRPSSATLLGLSGALDVPVEFFSTQWPTTAAIDGEPVTFFRDLRSTPVRERKRAAALALVLADLIAAIELHVRLPDLDLPHFPIGPKAGGDDVEQAALVARKAWGLGEAPIPNVIRELERHGVPIAHLTIGNRGVDAFTSEFRSRPIVLLTDDKSNYVRSRFDGAHELGHLVMHDGAEPGTRAVESQAQNFASAFLLPRSIAESELPKRLDGTGWARLAEMKRQWGISMSALIYRARTLRLIGEDAHRNAMVYLSARGWRTIEPGDKEMGVPESPLLIERCLRRIEVDSGMTALELIRDAHVPEQDALELITAARDQRPTIDL